MTNRKSTKRALLGSVMAMVLCLAMLVGATFAWFTDTASTGVNKIQAGEGKTMDFVKAADAENEAILWEPGCIYTLPELRVVNNGNLALKYMIKITGIKGDAKLNEAIELTIGDVAMGAEQHLAAGESNTFTIKGHMKESAGNDYMDLTISGISITVYATQNTVESDSFNNQYDKNAAYKGTQEFTEGTHTLSNGVVALNPNDIAVKASGRDTNVTITGGYYDGGNGGNNICVYAMDGATVTIQGGTFTVGSDASGEGNSVVESNGGNIVIEGGFFYTNYNWRGFYYVLNQKNDNPGTITVKGGTFVNYDPSQGDDNLGGSFVADGYSVVSEKHGDDTWYTVVKGTGVIPGTQEDLNNAISDSTNKDITVVMPADQTLTLDNGIANEGAKARNITFVDVTVQAGEGSFDGIVCDELVYRNCTIKGKLALYGKATFINCTFDNTMANQYSIWTWGGTDVTCEGCTFNTNGKAILLYGRATAEKPTDLVVNNCTFNDRKSGAAGKAAIEVGNDYNATYTLTVNHATVNGFAAGKNTGSHLWANKNSMDAAHLTVTIDGAKVQ